jgi:hypothetical protein
MTFDNNKISVEDVYVEGKRHSFDEKVYSSTNSSEYQIKSLDVPKQGEIDLELVVKDKVSSETKSVSTLIILELISFQNMLLGAVSYAIKPSGERIADVTRDVHKQPW